MTGLFETMLAVRGRIVQRDEHFARLARSARALQLRAPDAREFRQAAEAAVQPEEEQAVRCVYSEGRMVATANAIPAITLRRRLGARMTMLDRAIRREHPQHKLLSYMTSRPAIAEDCEEALFVDANGHVLEGTTTNVFAIAHGALITAGAAVLPGIVRAWVIGQAAEVFYRPPTREELCAGSFLTSSLTLLAPITSIDGIPCAAPGPLFDDLRERYRFLLETL